MFIYIYIYIYSLNIANVLIYLQFLFCCCCLFIYQVLEITCGDSKAAYDNVKSKRGHPKVADVAGADVSNLICSNVYILY